jgi:polysaccharide biosynthesis/export protein
MGKFLRYRPLRVWFSFAACIFVTIGASHVAAQQKDPVGNVLPEGYRIGVGDVLAIAVWREPDASVPETVVRLDGQIALPLVGDIAVAGRTPGEVQDSLKEKFGQFIRQPVVAVVVRAINSRRVYVVGAVHKEGPLNLTRPMTVLQALSEAGGLADFSQKTKIYILRKVDGRQVKLPFNYKAVVKGEHLEQNIVLMPDDTIFVPD